MHMFLQFKLLVIEVIMSKVKHSQTDLVGFRVNAKSLLAVKYAAKRHLNVKEITSSARTDSETNAELFASNIEREFNFLRPPSLESKLIFSLTGNKKNR